ncbi:1-phosphofructokinase family hexose kinase [Nakamurella leprariae]|uniref:Hexose kinase n=1 Tax=Nakamurella leprariae TaxID=2803911 RepID=A0A938YIP1_9ACTN|nr:hexose kinase [Nakamurella leprariae]MBM9469027.1 hexose kinase [Nakamurella leprariae]
MTPTPAGRRPRILTVTLNAALDVTYDVDAMTHGASHRVRAVRSRAGGKGVNVARVAALLGARVTASGLAGGPSGAEIVAELDAVPGVRPAFVPVAGASRRTVTVVDDAGTATAFNEAGPLVDEAEWACFRDRFPDLVADADVIVLSGSLPPGVPGDAYAALVANARVAGVPVILDADGPPLLAGLPAGPDVVKPNEPELRAATGTADPVPGAQALRRAGAVTVVASLGPAGLLAVTDAGAWQARPPVMTVANATGAGDAAVAAIAVGLARGDDWPAILRRAAAVSAASVTEPLGGAVDVALAERIAAGIDPVAVRPT